MSKRAEEAALKVYPPLHATDSSMIRLWVKYKHQFILGYEQAEKDIISLIESRISEIIGDAQPKPILRAELQELVQRIKKNDYVESR